MNGAERASPGLSRFLGRALFQVRWVVVAVLLLISTTMGPSNGGAVPSWALVVAFAGSTALADIVRIRFPQRFSLGWLALIDLPLAALLYLLGAEPGGPLFVLFVLAIDSAAASFTPRGTLLYTVAAGILATAADSMLPLWSPANLMDMRLLAVRLTMLALIGVGMAIVMRRLLLEREAAEQVRDEATQLEQLDRLRTSFIASVSHDLRTPLTAALAGLGAFDQRVSAQLQPPDRQVLGNVRRNVERLRILIDDLLAFNQIEAGGLRLDLEPFDLRAVVRNAVTTVQALLDDKRQPLELVLPVPLLVEGDSRRMEQVIVNLLANAHLHTPAGTRITIQGAVSPDGVRLDVRDNGSGIPPAEVERIFQRFHRLAASQGGSGLGLAIARGIVELHGGRMWAESEQGQGAVFAFWLPVTRNGDVV